MYRNSSLFGLVNDYNALQRCCCTSRSLSNSDVLNATSLQLRNLLIASSNPVIVQASTDFQTSTFL